VVGRGLTFPVAYGVTREASAVFGAWWDRDRGFIQPAECLLGRGGIVLGSMYASGPVGRMGADEVVRLITRRERRRREQEPGTHETCDLGARGRVLHADPLCGVQLPARCREGTEGRRRGGRVRPLVPLHRRRDPGP
jgi:hypothetical protein